MTILVVQAFQPFADRVGIDTVLALRFAYDVERKDQLKDILRVVKAQLCASEPVGGWCPEYKCWWAERRAWPRVKEHLAASGGCSPRLLITSINKQGTVFLWPVRLPAPDGRHDEWSKSALEAVNAGLTSWVRVQANMNLGAYEIHQALGTLADPEWELPPFSDLLRTTFKDRHITTPDHPVLRRLLGLS